MRSSQSTQHNRNAWQELARNGHRLARTVTAEELKSPLERVDSLGWLGGDIRGWQVLCLAAGGGRHGPLYTAAGANVTVVDFSSAMLDLDRSVQRDTGLSYQLIETCMSDLSGLSDSQFDLVIHPVSTCYLPDISRVFVEVARVTRPGGLYVSQHKQPSSLQASLLPGSAGKYTIEHDCYSGQPAQSETRHTNNLIREPETNEYVHRWETIVGGICNAGFVIEALVEPNHADRAAAAGSFGHRSCFLPPYVRIKARRRAETASSKPSLIY
ncbi:MAG: class I SAM-dependent methyltransferase [Pirellulaceae bacterium]